jgi:hypothetical protein
LPGKLEVLKMSIKNWYLTNYATDEEGSSINDGATFGELFEAIINGNDIYEVLGEWIDTVIRERVFEETAKQKGISYSYLCKLWEKGGIQ